MVSLVREIMSAKQAKEITGSCMFGSDSGKWPIKWFDGVTMYEAEQRRVKHHMDELVSRMRTTK